MNKQIVNELKKLAPFTFFGAISGIFILLFFQKISREISLDIFYILHPMHVFLSALVTASIYKLHTCGRFSEKRNTRKCNFGVLLLVGYTGTIGITTLSDCLIPYLGELLLDMPHRKIHLGFIEKWWLVNPIAIVGVIFGYFKPSTKLPHTIHVLLSTWATLFHIMMATGSNLNIWSYISICIFLFLAVWIPCCLSDIIFPLLFVNKYKRVK